jgi:hypothetical protein
MPPNHGGTSTRVLAAVLTAIALVACAPDATRPVRPSIHATLVAEGVSSLQAQQGEWARRVALALADPALRQRVKNDLRDSPITEFKLQFSDYLRGPSGSRILRRLAQTEGISEAAALQELTSMPPLEFYMPVAEHRKTWRGGQDLIVATQVEDTDPPVAWDTKGQRVTLSLSGPPPTPVLVLVPVETDFSEPLSPKALAQRGNPHRETIQDPSVTLIDCGLPTCGGDSGGSSGGVFPAGLYITFQRLVDKGEPWTLGAPEIEVHIHGPQSAGALQYGADLSCSGDRVGFPRGFNQDNAFWSGEALLFDQNQINNYNTLVQNGFNVSVWEDDNDKCSIKMEDFDLVARYRNIAVATAGYTAVSAATGIGPTIVAAATYIAAVYQSLTFLWTNDDYLGSYVNAAAVGLSYSDANHVLYKDGGTINGRAMIVSKGAH